MDLVDFYVNDYRKRNPSSRIQGLCYYSRNGCATRIRSCVCCGWSERFAGKWRRTDASWGREMEHIRDAGRPGGCVYERLRRRFAGRTGAFRVDGLPEIRTV